MTTSSIIVMSVLIGSFAGLLIGFLVGYVAGWWRANIWWENAIDAAKQLRKMNP